MWIAKRYSKDRVGPQVFRTEELQPVLKMAVEDYNLGLTQRGEVRWTITSK